MPKFTQHTTIRFWQTCEADTAEEALAIFEDLSFDFGASDIIESYIEQDVEAENKMNYYRISYQKEDGCTFLIEATNEKEALFYSRVLLGTEEVLKQCLSEGEWELDCCTQIDPDEVCPSESIFRNPLPKAPDVSS